MASARWVPGLDYTCISDWQLPYGSATGLSSLRSSTGCFTCCSYSSRHWGFTRSLWSCLKNRVKENCRTTQLFGAYSLKTIAHKHIGIPAIANSCFISNQDFYIWYYWVKKKKKKNNPKVVGSRWAEKLQLDTWCVCGVRVGNFSISELQFTSAKHSRKKNCKMLFWRESNTRTVIGAMCFRAIGLIYQIQKLTSGLMPN